jgi:hypothetical protein
MVDVFLWMVLVSERVDGALGATVVGSSTVAEVSGRLMLMAVDDATTVSVSIEVSNVIDWGRHISNPFYWLLRHRVLTVDRTGGGEAG